MEHKHSGADRVIPAIETRYKGFHFRSRSEARWAIFFDVLGIGYQYEPEKFQLSSSRYIPDFFIPFLGCSGEAFLEIKGPPPSKEEIAKIAALSTLREGATCFIAFGNVNENIIFQSEVYCCEEAKGEVCFCQCILCGRIQLACSIHGGVSHEEDYCTVTERLAQDYNIDCGFTDFTHLFCPATSRHSPLLVLATEVARSARFESPEFGAKIEAYKHTGEALRRSKAFGTSEDFIKFYDFVMGLSKDPHCPRYCDYTRRAG